MQLEFRIRNMNEGELRKRRTSKPKFAVIGLALAAAASIYSVSSTHSAEVHGTVVRANHVVVLRDESGSMSGTESKVATQYERLRAAGISIDEEIGTNGFAISFVSDYSVINALNIALSKRNPPDTLYIVTDFNGSDDSANQPEALAYMKEKLHGHRLYWAAVTNLPPPGYLQLALETGGGLIDAR